MGWRLRCILAIALLGIALLAVLARILPSNSVSDPASINRVRGLVEQLAQRPHPLGSREHARVHDFIIEQLRHSAVAVNEQASDAVALIAGANQGAHLNNVLATIPGRETTEPAIMLVAHYDTVPNSRGAGDDGAAVAALLETARIISARPRLRRTVHFLFTDAEEQGLLGAQAFVTANPIARRVGLVINFEGRGTSGPVIMYQTSPRSSALVAEYGKVAPFPHANSLISQLSRILPNDSDASIFSNSGFPVLAFAFVEGFENYHSYTDSSNNLDPRTLAHCAAQALALACHFGELANLPRSATDSVYFDYLSRVLIHYPCWLATVLGTLCALGWLLLARREIEARRCSARSIARGAKLQLLVMGLALVIPVMLHLVRSLMLDESELLRHSASYGFADLLVVAALNLLFHARAFRRRSRDLVLGSLAIIVTLGALLGWLVPQASAPWQWVSVCALVVLYFEPSISARHPKVGLAWQQLPLFVSVALMVPVVSTALASAGPGMMIVPLLLAASMMEFAFAILFPQAKGLAVASAATGIAGFLLMLGVALWPPPRLENSGLKAVYKASIVYAYDSDTNQALYAAQPTQYSAWTGQWVPRQSEQSTLPAFTPLQALWRQARAPIYPQPVPEISLIELDSLGSQRHVELRVSPTAPTDCVTVWQSDGKAVKALSVNSQPVAQFVRFSPQIDAIGLQLLSSIRERRVWKLSYCGLGAAPLIVRLELPQRQAVRLRIVSEIRALPKLMTQSKRPRPANLVPGRESDVTWVAQQIVM